MTDQIEKKVAEGIEKGGVQELGVPLMLREAPCAEELMARAEKKIEEVQEKIKKLGEPAPRGPHTVQLGPVMLLKIELLSTKQRLAEREEQLAKIALADAQKKKQEYAAEEKRLMSELSAEIGQPVKGNVRLVDREKGICQVG